MRKRTHQEILENYIPEPNTGCHLWLGAISPCGYGIIDYKTTTVTGEHVVTRIVWTDRNGRIPDGMKVCHRCDTPRCIRIEHLFLGTQRENIADMASKGRRARGRMLSNAKLTEDTVRAMRAEYDAGGVTTRDISAKYGVGPTVAFLVVKRQRWIHVQ